MPTQSHSPLVCAIVVGTNEKSWLEPCFSTLLGSDYPRLRIIYVDNASHDGSREFVLERFTKVTVLHNERNLGFTGANNVGMRVALKEKADYIFLVNPDTRTPPTVICAMVEFMERHRDYGIVGPLQTVYGADFNEPELNEWSKTALENGERHVFYHWEPWRASEAGTAQDRAEGSLEHAYVQGAAFFIRRQVLEQVGLLDETYHTYYEEVDLCRRARWHGYRVALLVGLYLQHKGGGGTQSVASRYRNYHYTRNKYIYLLTDPAYTFRDSLRLAGRFLRFDIKDAILRQTGNINDWQQMLSILWWLITHSRRIYRQRKVYLRLFSQGHRRSPDAPVAAAVAQKTAGQDET